MTLTLTNFGCFTKDTADSISTAVNTDAVGLTYDPEAEFLEFVPTGISSGFNFNPTQSGNSSTFSADAFGHINITGQDGLNTVQMVLDAAGPSIEISSAGIFTLSATSGSSIGAAGEKIGFIGATPIVRPSVTGDKAGNAALASLITALVNLGLITDDT